MSKMNLLVDLKGYDGSNANTCNPKFSHNAQAIGINISEEIVQEVTVAAAATVVLFTVITADAKKLIYLETDGECDIIVNGITETALKPLIIDDQSVNGMYLRSSAIETVSITNNGASDIKIYYITAK